METDSCEPRRGWGELLWETEHLGPALAVSSQEGAGATGLSFLQSDLQPSCCSVRPSCALLLCSALGPLCLPCLSLPPDNAYRVYKVQLRMGVWTPSVKCFAAPPGASWAWARTVSGGKNPSRKNARREGGGVEEAQERPTGWGLGPGAVDGGTRGPEGRGRGRRAGLTSVLESWYQGCLP